MNFSDPVIVAAIIGATATALTALVQLRLSWRKELKERERGQPITRKTRRGPFIAVLILIFAAGVGGFALSEYVWSWRDGEQETLRADLKSGLSAIRASAARLEQARLGERDQIESGARRAEALRLAEEGAIAAVVVGPCKPDSVAASGPRLACNEQNAVRVAVCARVPAAAVVREVQLYTRFEDAPQPAADARVQAGQDAGQARFSEKFFERPDTDGAKQVCAGFVNWNGEKSRLARILVKYTL
jgi:hypothetical protein